MAGGVVRECSEPVKDSNLKNGDSLTLHIHKVRIGSNAQCFTTILGDASVMTFWHAAYDGDSGGGPDQLKNVHEIQAARSAVAAILGNRSVATWGDTDHGGDSSSVQDQL